MKARYLLLALLLVGLLIKLYPPMTQDFLVNFDSIYHTRIGQIVADTGWVPSWDYVAGGRPHLYPPGYHLLLGYTSRLSGVRVFDLIGFVLPLVSSLLVLPMFFLIREYRDTKTALWGAAFMAFSPIVASQSYDSPHLFGLLLFPIIVYALLKKRYLLGGGLLAVCLLFNYGIVLTIILTMTAFSLLKLRLGEKRPLLYAVLISAIGIGLVSPWLLVSAVRAGECFDPSTAVTSVNEPGVSYLLWMAPFIAIVGIGLLYLTRKKNDDYALFWRSSFALGMVLFFVSLFVPQLHPYDQILLFGFSMPFLLAELGWRREYKLAIALFLLIGMLLSVMAVVPALSKDDVAAAEWVRDHVKDGNVLADLEMSSTINMMVMSPSIQTSFDQFLECIPDRQRWTDLHDALMTSDIEAAQELVNRYMIDYIIVGTRDSQHYGFDVEKFSEMEFETAFQSGEAIVYRKK